MQVSSSRPQARSAIGCGEHPMCFEPSTSSPLGQAGGQDPSSRRGRRLHYEPCATIETCIPRPRSCPQLAELTPLTWPTAPHLRITLPRRGGEGVARAGAQSPAGRREIAWEDGVAHDWMAED